MARDRPQNRPRRAFDGTTGGSEPTADTAAGLEGRFTEDEARPIFREAASDADAATVRTPASDATTPDPRPTSARSEADAPTSAAGADGTDTADGPDAADAADGSGAAEAGTGPTRAGRLNFTPRARPVEDDATTLLPRTAGRGEIDAAGGSRFDGGRDGDDDGADGADLDERPHRFGSRARLAVLAGAVVAVVVVGIAIGAAVIGVRDQPGAGADPTSGTSSSAATPSATALLDDTSMLTTAGAGSIDPKRTWTAGTTVRGAVPDGSGAACLGSDPLEGAPTAQQTITRTLTASGSSAPSAVHVAQAYATVEDATQAFATTSRALGSCAVTGDWLATGRVVQGVGDEATAVAVQSVVGGGTSRHWVVLSRTGRALDVVDASTPGKKALNVNDVTQALGSVVTGQCGAAGGACVTNVSTKDGPPPVGGDEPGFLATGDLPPVGSQTAPWVGTPVEAPSEDFTGSQCESVNWSTTAATAKSSRVYLLQDVPGIFGLNEIVLTARDASTAAKLTDKIRSDWTTCKERKLTATVASPTKVTGVAADGAAVSGWTTVVEQKAGSTTTRFRVGIASSGDKVAFVFLNPQKGLDVDGDDFNVVAVRAVQRATQQS